MGEILIIAMLPISLSHRYQMFCQLLQQVGRLVQQANPDAQTLQVTFLEAQQFFQQQMMSQPLEDLNSAEELKIQSLQTEIGKQLRLFAIDVMFLQTARQPVTIQQRQAQLCDRLQLLQRYCEAVLGEGGDRGR